MATIRSGAGTDQATVDPISKALRVTIYGANGVESVFTLNADTSTLARESGNLLIAAVALDGPVVELLRMIYKELRAQSGMLLDGLPNVNRIDYDGAREEEPFAMPG